MKERPFKWTKLLVLLGIMGLLAIPACSGGGGSGLDVEGAGEKKGGGSTEKIGMNDNSGGEISSADTGQQGGGESTSDWTEPLPDEASMGDTGGTDNFGEGGSSDSMGESAGLDEGPGSDGGTGGDVGGGELPGDGGNTGGDKATGDTGIPESGGGDVGSGEVVPEKTTDTGRPDLPPKCGKEGEIIPLTGKCCPGLKKVQAVTPPNCASIGQRFVCVKCGDGVCQWNKGENSCNCPSDCKKKCKKDSDCGKPTCSGRGMCEIIKPFCDKGVCSVQKSRVGNSVCNPQTNKCERISAQCKTRCDCKQGQECAKGFCVTPKTPVYCCDKPGCPAGQKCKDKSGKDGVCSTKKCSKDSDCGKQTCSVVSVGTGPMCIEKIPTCKNGVCSATVKRYDNRKCDRAGVKCVPTASQCKTHCDCPQGQACVSGQCVKPKTPVYCCTKAGCPAGQKCTDPLGKPGVCPASKCKRDADCGKPSCKSNPSTKTCIQYRPSCKGGKCSTSSQTLQNYTCESASGFCIPLQVKCKVDCDCPQGQRCSRGRCIVSITPAYCCDKPGCPPRQRCTNSKGVPGFCPIKKCTKNSDCGMPYCSTGFLRGCNQYTPQCVRGSCQVYKRTISGTYCDSTTGICKKNVCKNNCDCPQGMGCRNGRCVRSSTPVYCCTKPNCPAGRRCYYPDGKRGTCQIIKACKTNADCGKPSCRSNIFTRTCTQITPLCQNGRCSTQTKTVQNATCNRITGLCVPRSGRCKTNADCGKPSCRSSIFTRTCTQITPLCQNGRCSTQTKTVQNATCNRTTGLCVPRSGRCKTDADCGKPSCRNGLLPGTCTQTTPLCQNGRCSTKTQTVQNATCDRNTGRCVTKTSQCKTHCDCSQGFMCAQGKCISGFVPTYCCTKPGCPAGARCYNPDGSTGQCPRPKRCGTSADCGKPTCSQSGARCVQVIYACTNGLCQSQTVSMPNSVCNKATGICNRITPVP